MAKKPAAPKPPAHLSETEARVYTDTATLLAHPLSPMQLTLLEAYAIEFARWQESEAFIRQHGTTFEARDDKGTVKAVLEAPQLKIAQRARDAALALGVRLGLEG